MVMRHLALLEGLQHGLRGLAVHSAIHDLDDPGLDLGVQLDDSLLYRVAEGQPLDEAILLLAEPMDPARRLDLLRRIDGRLHQKDVVRSSERDPDGGCLVGHHEDAGAWLATILELLDGAMPLLWGRLLIELEDGKPI